MLDAVVDVVEIAGVPERVEAVAAFPEHVVAVVAFPVRAPTNVCAVIVWLVAVIEPVEVILEKLAVDAYILDEYMLEEVVEVVVIAGVPERFVAVVAFPESAPINVCAVMVWLVAVIDPVEVMLENAAFIAYTFDV